MNTEKRADISNTDQADIQNFAGVLRAHGIAISMDGRGRCSDTDNNFIERLRRSLKYAGV